MTLHNIQEILRMIRISVTDFWLGNQRMPQNYTLVSRKECFSVYFRFGARSMRISDKWVKGGVMGFGRTDFRLLASVPNSRHLLDLHTKKARVPFHLCLSHQKAKPISVKKVGILVSLYLLVICSNTFFIQPSNFGQIVEPSLDPFVRQSMHIV